MTSHVAEIILALEEFGLSDKQARVYAALLSLRDARATEISEIAKVKRPTTYLALEELQAKGLVISNQRTGVERYCAVSCLHLLEKQKQQGLRLAGVIGKMLSDSHSLTVPQQEIYSGAVQFKEFWTRVERVAHLDYLGDINFAQPSGAQIGSVESILQKRQHNSDAAQHLPRIRCLIPYEPDPEVQRHRNVFDAQREWLILRSFETRTAATVAFISSAQLSCSNAYLISPESLSVVSFQEALIIEIISRPLVEVVSKLFGLAFDLCRAGEPQLLSQSDQRVIQQLSSGSFGRSSQGR